mmetsp:Transcript_14553/g.35120  ORF Transcript_14553/g.35120 Transcript_14553/m.35120 type:complete len:247 (-) Transcript_14553:689-1429(-)
MVLTAPAHVLHGAIFKMDCPSINPPPSSTPNRSASGPLISYPTRAFPTPSAPTLIRPDDSPGASRSSGGSNTRPKASMSVGRTMRRSLTGAEVVTVTWSDPSIDTKARPSTLTAPGSPTTVPAASKGSAPTAPPLMPAPVTLSRSALVPSPTAMTLTDTLVAFWGMVTLLGERATPGQHPSARVTTTSPAVAAEVSCRLCVPGITPRGTGSKCVYLCVVVSSVRNAKTRGTATRRSLCPPPSTTYK